MEWTQDASVLRGQYTQKKSKSVTKKDWVGFDLDGTIITTSSGAKFAKHSGDWKYLFDSVPDELRKLDKKYHVVIISNQKGLNSDSKISSFKDKLNAIAKDLDIPLWIYAALKGDRNRKPLPDIVTRRIGKEMDGGMTYYCGDAAGRSDDFSDTDLKFALNLGVEFRTPEQVFKDKTISFSPQIKLFDDLRSKQEAYKIQSTTEPEMVIMVALPASGKSYYASQFPSNYTRINRDTLGTMKKCLQVVEKEIDEGHNIIIDNTNVSVESRKDFIALAKRRGYRLRAIVIDTPEQVYEHNNHIRWYLSDGETSLVPSMVYRMMKKKFEEPTKKEGFDFVEKVGFVLQNTPEVKSGKYFTYTC